MFYLRHIVDLYQDAGNVLKKAKFYLKEIKLLV